MTAAGMMLTRAFPFLEGADDLVQNPFFSVVMARYSSR